MNSFHVCLRGPGNHFTKIKELLRKIHPYTKSFVKINEFFKYKYPLAYYRGHYFHDTPVTISPLAHHGVDSFQVSKVTVNDENWF